MQFILQRAVDVSAAGVPNGVQPGIALLSAECGESLDRSWFAEVVPKYSNVDILRETVDQAVGLRQRGAAFEKKAWPAR
jgi:hypothetical protein